MGTVSTVRSVAPGLGWRTARACSHARQPQVLDVGGAARDLGRDVHARQGAADHPVGRRVLQPSAGLGRHVQREAGRKVAVGQRTPVRRLDRAIFGLQLRWGQAEPAGGCLDQQAAHLGGGVQDRRPAVLHGMAAGGEALVGRASGVGGDQIQAGRRHVELLGGNLEQRGLETLPKLRLAGEHLDTAIRRDPDPRIEFGRFLQAARQRRGAAGRRGTALFVGAGSAAKAEGHDESAAGAKQVAAGQARPGAHRSACPMEAAARRTARRMRTWVPQRQRLGAMCARISASLGAGLASSSACARTTMPAMQ